MPSYYPVFLDLRDVRCLVVGGGSVAERKAESLLECEAAVTVVSPRPTARLRQLAELGRLIHVARAFEPEDLDGAVLVIAATDSRATNGAIAERATSRGLLVNVVDDPSSCSFFVPAVVRRGDLAVAISTGARSPALARRAREQIEELFPAGYEQVVDQVGALRQRIRTGVADARVRASIWHALMADGLVELLRAGASDEVERRLEGILADLKEPVSSPDPDDD